MSKQAYTAQFMYKHSAKRRTPWVELDSVEVAKWMSLARHAMTADITWNNKQEAAA
jgi:hypothetical protein